LTPLDIKKALLAAGLEVYRTTSEEVVLADRVRENLIMDSGVRIRSQAPGFEVAMVLRVRRAHFPNENDGVLFEHVRKLGNSAVDRGFAERESRVTPLSDPGDPDRVLDTFYEVVFIQNLGSLDDAIDATRFALDVAKAAEPNR
jgi:hypothetical protein